MERRLSAILSADVVGYSRMMAADEEGTLARLQDCRRNFIEPAIGNHHGRIVKLMGDGVLAEFASVVDAVRCAIAMQREIAAHAVDAPQDRRMEFRIGINTGDIIVEDDDIYGDGVNVAARLQELADPGGVLISGDAYRQVRGKLDFGYVDLGARALKNIPDPITVYSVLPDAGLAGSDIAAEPAGGNPRRWVIAAAAVVIALIAAGATWNLYLRPPPPQTASPDRVATLQQSIAVLAFNNMSDDPGQEYFADGMAEDIITDLSKISGLFVIARNTSFAYKGQSPDIREIGRELGVGYVLEGSVRKASGRIRINVQLIDASSGHHIWAERYDREEEDVFELQDEVRGKVIKALKVKLSPDEETRLARRLTDSPEAYDLWLRGRRQESFFTEEANLESRRLYALAIELDPGFAAAYASLGTAYNLAAQAGWWDTREEFVKTGLRMAEKAVALDDTLPQAHWALARALTRGEAFDGDRAIAELEKTLILDPNYADAHALLANVMIATGRAGEALAKLEQAMRLNPRFPYWYYSETGRSQYMLTHYDAAARSFEKALEKNPTVTWPRLYLVAAYGQLGRIDDALWELEELQVLGHNLSIKHIRENSSLQDSAYLERYMEGLRKAGVPD